MLLTPNRPGRTPNRGSSRPRRPSGLDPRDRRKPYTAADLEWAAYELNRRSARDEALAPAGPAPDWDALADEALAQSRLDRGLCP